MHSLHAGFAPSHCRGNVQPFVLSCIVASLTRTFLFLQDLHAKATLRRLKAGSPLSAPGLLIGRLMLVSGEVVLR